METPNAKGSRAIIGIVVVIIVVGAVWAMANKSAPTNSPADPDTKNTNTNAAKAQSLKALLAANTPQECSFQTTVDTSTSEGKVYMARGMMRGDFTLVSGDETFTSHMITKDGSVYSWVENMTTGFKTSIDAGTGANTENGQKEAVDMDQELNYDCQPWSADASTFELPANVEFNDLGAMMKPKLDAPANTDDTNAQCGACDQVPAGPTRDQCKSALGCK